MQNVLLNELQNEYLSIALPNELFEEIPEMIKNKELQSVHAGYTYSYIYLQTYLYRYAFYGRNIPSSEDIKEVLTYSRSDKRTNYITKKNGLLESKSILTTTNEFPIITEYEDADTSLPTFITIREYAKEYTYDSVDDILKRTGGTRRSTCMYPEFAFERIVYEDDVINEGTFYDITNTTLLDMKTFMFCVNTEDVGVNGFYLYAYLTHQNFKFNNNFAATSHRIGNETGLSARTVERLLTTMRQHNMIKTIHNMECISKAVEKEDRKASSHIVNSTDVFTEDKTVEHIPLTFVSEKWYKENQIHKKLEISPSELPF